MSFLSCSADWPCQTIICLPKQHPLCHTRASVPLHIDSISRASLMSNRCTAECDGKNWMTNRQTMSTVWCSSSTTVCYCCCCCYSAGVKISEASQNGRKRQEGRKGRWKKVKKDENEKIPDVRKCCSGLLLHPFSGGIFVVVKMKRWQATVWQVRVTNDGGGSVCLLNAVCIGDIDFGDGSGSGSDAQHLLCRWQCAAKHY